MRRADNLASFICRHYRHPGRITLLEPFGSVQACLGIAYRAYSSVLLNCLEGGTACKQSRYMTVALIRGTSCRLKLFGRLCFEPQLLLSGTPYWLSLVSWLFVAKIGITWSGVLLLHFCSCILFQWDYLQGSELEKLKRQTKFQDGPQAPAMW